MFIFVDSILQWNIKYFAQALTISRQLYVGIDVFQAVFNKKISFLNIQKQLKD